MSLPDVDGLAACNSLAVSREKVDGLPSARAISERDAGSLCRIFLELFLAPEFVMPAAVGFPDAGSRERGSAKILESNGLTQLPQLGSK